MSEEEQLEIQRYYTAFVLISNLLLEYTTEFSNTKAYKQKNKQLLVQFEKHFEKELSKSLAQRYDADEKMSVKIISGIEGIAKLLKECDLAVIAKLGEFLKEGVEFSQIKFQKPNYENKRDK